jgi:hypothetical protein
MRGLFEYHPGNFSFTIPEGWQKVAVTEVPPLRQFKKPLFGLNKTGTSCYLAYFDEEIDREYYEQTGFGTRTFAGGLQFDSQWYAPSETLPEDFTFSHERAQHFKQEFYHVYSMSAVPTHTQAPVVALFDAEGGTVEQSCADDMKPLTESWKVFYPSLALSRDVSGFLFVGLLTTTERDKNEPHLLFKSDADGLIYTLGSTPARWSLNHTFHPEGTIEGLTEKNTLLRFNVFTGKTEHSQPLVPKGTVIDYYRYLDKEWALVVADQACLDKGSCPSELYSKQGDVFSKVWSAGSNPQGPASILGYIPEKKQVVLRRGYADAGCSSNHVSLFDETTKKMTEAASYASCDGEAETPSQIAARKKIAVLTEAAGIRRQSKLLRVERGMLDFADAETVPQARWTSFIEHFAQ